MPKVNKPRHRDIEGIQTRAEREAADWLASVDASTIREATLFSDGSMTILHDVNGQMFVTAIEHYPEYGKAISRLLEAAGVEVNRR